MANAQNFEDLVREYEGQDLYAIGSHITEKSFYKVRAGEPNPFRVGKKASV